MTQPLRNAINALSSLEDLPDEQQDAIAAQIMDVIEHAEKKAFLYRVPFGGRCYSKEERAEAVAQWDAMDKPSLEGLSIRELIDEGRKY